MTAWPNDTAGALPAESLAPLPGETFTRFPIVIVGACPWLIDSAAAAAIARPTLTEPAPLAESLEPVAATTETGVVTPLATNEYRLPGVAIGDS